MKIVCALIDFALVDNILSPEGGHYNKSSNIENVCKSNIIFFFVVNIQKILLEALKIHLDTSCVINLSFLFKIKFSLFSFKIVF